MRRIGRGRAATTVVTVSHSARARKWFSADGRFYVVPAPLGAVEATISARPWYARIASYTTGGRKKDQARNSNLEG